MSQWSRPYRHLPRPLAFLRAVVASAAVLSPLIYVASRATGEDLWVRLIPLGAVVALFFKADVFSLWTVPVAAFLGALLSVGAVYTLATRAGRTEPTTLLLAGVGLGSLWTAIISTLFHFTEDGVLRQVVYWLMGNLGGKTWEHALIAVPFVLLSSLGLWAYSRELNIMTFGEDQARSMGVAVGKTRQALLILVALNTGAAVSVSGIIGFVGLIVPHIMRLLIGPDHRWLLPASGLAGASFLVLCDLLARTLAAPVELRTGIITAFFGVPFFLYLLVKRQNPAGWE